MQHKFTPTEQTIMDRLAAGPLLKGYESGRCSPYHSAAFTRLQKRGLIRLTVIDGRCHWVLAEPAQAK